MNKGQIDYLQEISVDLFAGGGGASTGYELATGYPVSIAINHNAAAIRMHRTNHPWTEHYQADVFDVDPREAVRGRKVGFLWASPDCRHFSKAKGSPLVDRKIRGLAWVILRWALDVRPRVIMAENVEEIQGWGPLIWDEGRQGWMPDPARKGETFRAFVGMLTTGVPADCPALDEVCEFLRIGRQSPAAQRLIRGLGYNLEHRELVAADYGAPTIRKRWCMVARCDGEPIVWPESTHSKTGTNGRHMWRSAAEIIDWSLPMYSVFDTKAEIKARYGVNAVRPLAENTLRRVIRGVDKFTIRSGRPFLVPTCYGERRGQKPRVHDLKKALPTIVGKGVHSLCDPVLAPVVFANTGNSVGGTAASPVPTLRASGGEVLASAQLIQYHTEQSEDVRASGLERPMLTVDGSNRYALVSAQLTEYYGNGAPADVRSPLRTATSHDREALISAALHPMHAGGYKGTGNSPAAPVNTITASGGNALSAAHIVKFKGQNLGQGPEAPLQTVTQSAGTFAACRAVLEKTERFRDLGRWPEIRALLNKYCGYSLGEDEIIILVIGGEHWYIRDILLRMLAPRELYSAMGFPADYIIDRDYKGRAYGKTEQVARCGNAVCPPLAEALIRANYKAAPVRITTMAQLAERVSV